MRRCPDIDLTDDERSLLAKIAFDWSSHDELQASLMPMTALAKSLLKRDAIPKVRWLYFTDPERNPSGRGKSRKDVFEKNGTVGAEIIAHPHFLAYLDYFVHGPKLPEEVIQIFREASAYGHLSGSDLLELTPKARAAVRDFGLSPYNASDEFHKLALECGAMPSFAAALRQSVRSIRIPNRR